MKTQTDTSTRRRAYAMRTSLDELAVLIRPTRWSFALGLALIAINRCAGLVLPASAKFLIDDVVLRHNIKVLHEIIAAVIVATLIQGGTSFTLTQLISNTAQRVIAERRRQMQRHVGRLSVPYHDKTKSGALLSRIMWDIDGIGNLIGTGLVDFAGGLLTALFALTFLAYISPPMTAMALMFVVLLLVILAKAMRRIRPMFLERKKAEAEVSGRLAESLGGIRVVKAYAAERSEAQIFSRGVQRILVAVVRTFTAISWMNVALAVAMGLIGASAMYLGAYEMLSGRLSLGGYCTYTMVTALLIAPVQQVVTIAVQVTESLAGLERTREVLNEEPEGVEPQRTIALDTIEGNVEFRNVCFGYERGQEVLHQISFAAPGGSVTALIGPSGSGKSTTMGLLAGFYIPSSGRILVDNMDVNSILLESYRRTLGIVLQESFLFDGTIWENVAFGRPDAKNEDILRACRIAHVSEFAERLQKGYQTMVGERGVALSGGQRQRLSIARAIVADPRILILDEATSSLDSESEALIQDAMRFLMAGRTTFVIAHRLSTIRRADQILVLEKGRIIERGSHSALYALRGRYFELYTQQNETHQGVNASCSREAVCDQADSFQAVGENGGIS